MSQPTPELLPCPFCGIADALKIREEVHDGSVVFCQSCLMYGPCPDLQEQGDPKEAIAAWNHRVPSPVNAALRDTLESLMVVERDVISVMLGGQIPGWQRIEKQFEAARAALAALKGQNEDRP